MPLFNKFNLSDDEDGQPLSQKLKIRGLFGTTPDLAQGPVPVQGPSNAEDDDNDKPQAAPALTQKTPDQGMSAEIKPEHQGDQAGHQEQPHEGFLTQLKNAFLGKDDEVKNDASGVQLPHSQHHSNLERIIRVGLPALFGMTSGVGLPIGLMAGRSSMQGLQNSELTQDQARYKNQTTAQNDSDENDQKVKVYNEVTKPTSDSQIKYRNLLGKSASENADTKVKDSVTRANLSSARADDLTEPQRMAQIEADYTQGKYVSPVDKMALKDYKRRTGPKQKSNPTPVIPPIGAPSASTSP